MRSIIITAALLMAMSSAYAEEPQADKAQAPEATAEQAVDSMAGTELNDADCTGIWLEINPQNEPSVTQKQVVGHVADFAKANPDGDDTIDQTEWMAACKGGLVTKTKVEK